MRHVLFLTALVSMASMNAQGNTGRLPADTGLVEKFKALSELTPCKGLPDPFPAWSKAEETRLLARRINDYYATAQAKMLGKAGLPSNEELTKKGRELMAERHHVDSRVLVALENVKSKAAHEAAEVYIVTCGARLFEGLSYVSPLELKDANDSSDAENGIGHATRMSAKALESVFYEVHISESSRPTVVHDDFAFAVLSRIFMRLARYPVASNWEKTDVIAPALIDLHDALKYTSQGAPERGRVKRMGRIAYAILQKTQEMPSDFKN
jgi:hypothetical protein